MVLVEWRCGFGMTFGRTRENGQLVHEFQQWQPKNKTKKKRQNEPTDGHMERVQPNNGMYMNLMDKKVMRIALRLTVEGRRSCGGPVYSASLNYSKCTLGENGLWPV